MRSKTTAVVGFLPVRIAQKSSSLPAFLEYAPASILPPAKDGKPAPWLRSDAFAKYINGEAITDPALEETQKGEPPPAVQADASIAVVENRIGIGIAADTGTQDGERFYTTEYLRLRENWKLGILADAQDKDAGDLIGKFFQQKTAAGTPARHHIVIGGQQGVCAIEEPKRNSADGVRASALPLPQGNTTFSAAADGKVRVKWVLLTAAIFPELHETEKNADGTATPVLDTKGNPVVKHLGGWLPNWVSSDGRVQLLDGPGKNFAKRHRVLEGKPIAARLVAALVGKPIVVTGWSLGDGRLGADGKPLAKEGAKPAQLAVPAGSVYYFECESTEAAQKLAAALNWHGAADANDKIQPAEIKKRRSTLLGEKGYGLGICAPWQPFPIR
jgi:hypothetical protein